MARSSSAAAVKTLVEAGAVVEARDHIKRTPLFYAAEHNADPDVVKMLIFLGSNAKAMDDRQRTPPASCCFVQSKHRGDWRAC